MTKIMRVCGWLILSLFFVGCTTGSLDSDPVNFSLAAINKGVSSTLSMGIQNVSENQREIFAKPFLVVTPDKFLALGYRDRGRAHVTILGDSRPYTIEVEVYVERGHFNNKGFLTNEYQFVRYDKSLAQKMLRDILSSSQHNDQDKNIIDDFRSF